MSKENDCSILYMMAVNKYSENHNMAIQQVFKIFNDNQIMEKIVAQHDYLHQLAFQYTMEYVEECLRNPQDLILFHGTISDFERINLEKSRKNTDFGIGFYTTLLEPQAKEWGLRIATMKFSKKYFVNRYSYHPTGDVKIKRFSKCTKEWLEMIRENRSKGGVQHNFDIVFGPVADDNTLPTIQRYMQGRLSAEEAIQRLEYTKITNQVSFHTKKGLECLWLSGKDRYDVER